MVDLHLDAVFGNFVQSNRVCLGNGAGGFTCSDVSADPTNNRGVALSECADGSTPPCIPPTNEGDHYLSYDVKEMKGTPKFEKRNVILADQFETGTFEGDYGQLMSAYRKIIPPIPHLQPDGKEIVYQSLSEKQPDT